MSMVEESEAGNRKGDAQGGISKQRTLIDRPGLKSHTDSMQHLAIVTSVHSPNDVRKLTIRLC